MGVALLLFVGLFAFTFWLESKIENMVAKQSNGVYRLQLYGLETSPFLGSLSVDSLSLAPDYKRWEELNGKGQQVPRTLLDLRTNGISMRRLSYAKVLFSQDVVLDELAVQQPNMVMTVMRQDTTTTHKPLHETLKGFMNGLAIGKIDVNQASLHYRSGAQSDTMLSVQRFLLTVTDFKLNSASFHAKDRAYYAQKYEVQATDASFLLPDGLYKATTDSLFVNSVTGEIIVKKIQLNPLVGPAALARAKGEAVTHQELKVEQVACKGMDFGKHSRSNEVRIKYVLVQTPSLIAFKDKQHFNIKGKKPMPHEMVQSIKTPFLIDSLELKNGYARYAELVPEAAERGHITFHKLNAVATNISNIPEQISMEKPAVIKASTMVMDRAKLEVTARIPLLHKNGYHTLEGTIGEANLQMLNPILIPTAFVRMESGQVRSGSFKAELNDSEANGNLTLLYSNLKIDLLTKGSGGEQGLGKNVLSFLANTVAIKDANPSEGEKPRIGTIMVNRDPQRSFLSYWKDCISSGFLSSMGLKGMAKGNI
ncbi:hypothetical protein [uncultured Pontibacter sp.]|uniref:hypothetical protein n=1 Tax=uncultured Pontibacter sp. TaxID=453356 RepID=UPI0026081160|nr:hypothetical protein [uncultured Pontibacter sp.]